MAEIQENAIHFKIEGRFFKSARHVHVIAKEKGFDGHVETIRARLKRGLSTWEEICAPAANSGRRPRDKSDTLAAIASVEARKKEIAERLAAQEDKEDKEGDDD